MHLVIDNHACLTVIDRIDGLVRSVFFVAIEVFRLSTVARVVEEERVVGLSTPDEPAHCVNDVCVRRLLSGAKGWIVHQNDHVLLLVTVSLFEKSRNVSDVVMAASERIGRSDIVDTYEKGFTLAGAIRVLVVEWLLLIVLRLKVHRSLLVLLGWPLLLVLLLIVVSIVWWTRSVRRSAVTINVSHAVEGDLELEVRAAILA